MYPHRIRLRGPWECEPLRRLGTDAPPAPRRAALPCRWADAGLADFAGRVRFRRRFGYPGRLDGDERVWLTCAGLSDTADVRLNDTALAERQTAPFEFDVTALLRARNELEMDVEGGADGGVWGEVAGKAPILSLEPTITPPLVPPPAKKTDCTAPQWSRPGAL